MDRPTSYHWINRREGFYKLIVMQRLKKKGNRKHEKGCEKGECLGKRTKLSGKTQHAGENKSGGGMGREKMSEKKSREHTRVTL